jgi:predicted lipid-binding transport protein (Tim44 family)
VQGRNTELLVQLQEAWQRGDQQAIERLVDPEVEVEPDPWA